MRRCPLGVVILLALGGAPLPGLAQESGPDVLKPFRIAADSTPIPRAIPVERPIPRAVPVEKPGSSSAPKSNSPTEPAEPGTITVGPRETGTADQVQLSLADSYYAKKAYDMAAPEYEGISASIPPGRTGPRLIFVWANAIAISAI